ncbi:MAG: hypothetical protein ACE149_19375 [Armatimonadota bacterium]
MSGEVSHRSGPARLRGNRAGSLLSSGAQLAVLAAAGAALAILLAGCSNRAALHPGLRVQSQDVERATKRGQSMIAAGEAPEDAFAYRTVDVSERLSSDVIVRSAGICLPVDRLVYEIAKSGDASDRGVRRAVSQATRAADRELMFVASVQLSQGYDPATIQFWLMTNSGTRYPPIAVETPVLLREVRPSFDPTAGMANLYYYVVHFPVSGGPGVPPIGPEVTSLTLIVSDGTSEARVEFPLPRAEQQGW